MLWMWSKTSTIADKVGNFLESGIRLLDYSLENYGHKMCPGEGWHIPSCRGQSPVTGEEPEPQMRLTLPGPGVAGAGARVGSEARVTPVTVRLQSLVQPRRVITTQVMSDTS